jgi:hypothetical protein
MGSGVAQETTDAQNLAAVDDLRERLRRERLQRAAEAADVGRWSWRPK